MKRLSSILLAIYLLSGFAFAQIFPGTNIVVKENGEILQNAWLGGLDLPQFSGGDINQDGREDLLVFDRKGSKLLVLLKNETGQYEYAPNFEKFFPDLVNFALFKDYNCDGLVDIFTFVNTGIKVFRQEIVNSEITFVLASSLLEFDLAGFDVNIYNSNGDIPGIEDIDGDGDIDVTVFYSIGTTLPMYRNLSVENGFGCDSLIFEEYSSCWGQFSESSTTNAVNFDVSCKGTGIGTPIASGGPKHTGSTILLLDENEDGKMDLILGDVAFNTLVYLQNDATSLDAHMSSSIYDFSFPSYDTPANVEIFPAAFYVDVTNDGKKDLLVAPNSTTAHLNQTSSWLYENTGNAASRFSFVKNDFLIDESIDLGSYSYPYFFDHNGDGLEDLLVANGYIFNFLGNSIGTIYYYENTGEDTLPEFTLVTDDYLGLRNLGLDFMRPTMGDLDDDGDQDMIIGDANGLIHYFENSAGAGNLASFLSPQIQYAGIDVGNKAHPQLVDVNEDGLLDLLIGREGNYGEIAYFWNYGTAQNPMFSTDSVNNAFGKIRTNLNGFVNGNSSPLLFERNGERTLYVGSEFGNIMSFEINPDSLKNGSFVNISGGLLPVKIGSRSTLSIIDIDQDNGLEYFIGNARGGVSFYSENGTDTVNIGIKEKITELGPNFEIYPNPSKDFVWIELDKVRQETFNFKLFNVLGQLQIEGNLTQVKNLIPTNNLSSGLYFVKLTSLKGDFSLNSFVKE